MFREPLTPLELGDTWSQTWTNFGKIGKSGILLTAKVRKILKNVSQKRKTNFDSTFFCVELSPTSRYIFIQIFFLRKDKAKLHRGKFLFLQISLSKKCYLHFSAAMGFQNWPNWSTLWAASSNLRFPSQIWKFLPNRVFFLGRVLVHLYAEKIWIKIYLEVGESSTQKCWVLRQ